MVFEKLATFLNYHWQDDVFVNAVNNTIIDDYGVLDCPASYKLSEGASIFSKITNITDEIYASSDMPEGLRAGAPRIATLGLSLISDQADSSPLGSGLTAGSGLFIIYILLLGSSVVEQVTVNHLVAGSNPARAAIIFIYDQAPATFPAFDVVSAC